MNEADVLKEFLVSLGFRIDEAGGKKFRSALTQTQKDALALSGSVIGIGIAIEKFVESMANGLARLFYISERSGATVAGLKATESAFQGIGLQAGVATEAVEALGDMLRKPWRKTQIAGLGIDVNKPTEKVAHDLEERLVKMMKAAPGGYSQVAVNFAKDFLHMDERTFVQLTKEWGTLENQLKSAADRIKESGQNYALAAEKGAEFNRQLNLITQDFGALGAKFLGLNNYMQQSVETLEDFEDALHRMLKGDWANMFSGPDRGIHMRKEDEERLARATGTEIKHGAAPEVEGSLRVAARHAALNAGIDPVLFEAQIEQESGFNPNAKSKAGAIGVAQFMPKTAHDRGFNAGEDPYRDLRESANMMREMMNKYHGDITLALEAYNAGSGRLHESQHGGRPLEPETLKYPGQVMDRANRIRLHGDVPASAAPGAAAGASGGAKVYSPNVTNNYNISSSDPHAAGDAAATSTERMYSGLFRDQAGMFGA